MHSYIKTKLTRYLGRCTAEQDDCNKPLHLCHMQKKEGGAALQLELLW